MNPTSLSNLVKKSQCRVTGWENAGNGAHRQLLGAIVRGFDHADSTILCEPSLVRSNARPPDIVAIDPIAGLHVLEIKGIVLDQIVGIEAGGQFKIEYDSSPSGKNPFFQVRNALLDIKSETQRAFMNQGRDDELSLPFKYWVVLARITKAEWREKWQDLAPSQPELLFADDVARLPNILKEAGKKRLDDLQLDRWPPEELNCVLRAFGDTSVLKRDQRERQPVTEGSLGELFEDAAEAYKALSDDQQRLSEQHWASGPRLIRGVAGSGKTIVLANNYARRLVRSVNRQRTLLGENRFPRIAAVCFNRKLVPFIRRKIETAYQQRTGTVPDPALIQVLHFNGLMWHLSQKGLWRYQGTDHEEVERAKQYLHDLKFTKENDPSTFERCALDAIYVDEGQDFHEDEFRLLKEICGPGENDEPSLFIFYDDAQNLFGRKRPVWKDLDISIGGGGRAHVMTECFRNTKPIVEFAFNVLYGSFATDKAKVPTRGFADVKELEDRQLLRRQESVWQVGFAKRDGLPVKVKLVEGRQAEETEVVTRLRWLIEEQKVRPEDILVLSLATARVERLAMLVEKEGIAGVSGVNVSTKNKDESLQQRGWLTCSTIAASKGYDAYCVLLASANLIPMDVQGRASFYVGCTRAIEYLEVFGFQRAGLMEEMQRAIEAVPRSSK